MNREGQNWEEEEIPGSGRSIRGYILTYIRLKKGEWFSALGSQQCGPRFLRPQHPAAGHASSHTAAVTTLMK